MRVLVLGAGGTGGYFGGRLLEAGRDVSFLVRNRRAVELAETGLVIRSPAGNAWLKPRIIVPGESVEGFDLVILACKAYDLDSAIDSIAPAVGRKTVVLPLLNGLRHYDALDARFGPERVLGGLCSIAVTLGGRAPSSTSVRYTCCASASAPANAASASKHWSNWSRTPTWMPSPAAT